MNFALKKRPMDFELMNYSLCSLTIYFFSRNRFFIFQNIAWFWFRNSETKLNHTINFHENVNLGAKIYVKKNM